MAKGLELHVESGAPGTHVVRVAGELDLSTVEHLRATLIEVAGSTVYVDCAGLSFVDVYGLSGLVAAQRTVQAAGHRLVITGAPAHLRRLVALTDLDGLLE